MEPPSYPPSAFLSQTLYHHSMGCNRRRTPKSLTRIMQEHRETERSIHMTHSGTCLLVSLTWMSFNFYWMIPGYVTMVSMPAFRILPPAFQHLPWSLPMIPRSESVVMMVIPLHDGHSFSAHSWSPHNLVTVFGPETCLWCHSIVCSRFVSYLECAARQVYIPMHKLTPR